MGLAEMGMANELGSFGEIRTGSSPVPHINYFLEIFKN